MRFERPRPRNDEERVLPLINVVFLLLVFFMLAGRLASSDPFAVEPPRSASEAAAEAQPIVVAVAADGRLALDGEAVDAAALERALEERTREGTPGRTQLKADGAASSTRVIEVMELLRSAGVERIELLTRAQAGS